jgi:SNF2 family DNA or RNA helicase
MLGDLTRRIRPFLLRRTKVEVLPDLPAKIEQTSYATLTQNQLALYQQTLQRLRKRLKEAVEENALGQSRIEILAGLTRLRQICDHPGLIHPQYRSADGLSGKLELFEELLDECLDGGHKVLVFSQFTRMLSILRGRLDNRRTPYCSLEGQTVDRQSVVDQFNQSPGISVFLISLKAGGYGLNLTSADTVILFDPWWNPMVEDQAADRAHRFGQQRAVTVYRLITQGTIEEKMELLQSKKRSRFDRVVNQTDDHHGALSLDDLRYLIEG